MKKKLYKRGKYIFHSKHFSWPPYFTCFVNVVVVSTNVNMVEVSYVESNEVNGVIHQYVANKERFCKDFDIQTFSHSQSQESWLMRAKQLAKNAFLPEGFPHSVSEDYIHYQIWDTLQAFASSISGSLATQVPI